MLTGDARFCKEAADLGLENIRPQDVQHMPWGAEKKKFIKKLGKRNRAFVATESMMKRAPRLLSLPGQLKSCKFPTLLLPGDSLARVVEELRSTVKFQLKKVLGLHCAIGHCAMTSEQLRENVALAVRFLASILKRNSRNIRTIHIKPTMGRPYRLY